jgi:hypothetical protein
MTRCHVHWQDQPTGPGHTIPALHAWLPGVTGPSVVVLHGLGADKETQRKEAEDLARAGMRVVVPDAPHHGARRSPWLDRMAEATGAEAHLLFLRMLPLLVYDTLAIVHQLRDQGHGPVGLLGISMGAFAALDAACRDDAVAATVSILGSPDWSPRRGPVTEEMRAFLPRDPAHNDSRLAGRPLFMANAGRDEHVDPAPARRLAQALRPLFATTPDCLVHLEYPDSGHFMREEDWADMWPRAVRFLAGHLGAGAAP